MPHHRDVAVVALQRFLQIVIFLGCFHSIQYSWNETHMSSDHQEEQSDFPVIFVTHGA